MEGQPGCPEVWTPVRMRASERLIFCSFTNTSYDVSYNCSGLQRTEKHH